MARSGGKNQRGARRLGAAFLTLVSIALMVLSGVLVTRYISERDAQQAEIDEQRVAMQELLGSAVIYEGIVVDGVPLGGLSMEQAAQKLKAREQALLSRVSLSINYMGQSFPLTAQDIGYSFNTEAVLAQVWAVGRTGTEAERLDEISLVAQQGRAFSIDYTYEKELLRAAAVRVAEQLDRPPVEASVNEFDPATLAFNHTQGESGIEVDQQKLYDDLVSAIEGENLGASVQVSVATISPSAAPDNLLGRFGLISTFTTQTSSNKDRNSNIKLCSGVLNMMMIMPGDTFSINETTGPRTVEKGYLEAAAYRNGRSVPEIAGGVCQVSSTFFNAAIQGGINVVERYSHSMTVDYVDLGQDAAIDFTTGKDLKIQNTTDYPMWIVTSFADRTLTISFYGYIILEPGVTRAMRTEILETIEPGTPQTIVNTSLKAGEEQVVTTAKTGYKTLTYLQTIVDGKVVDDVLLHKSDYRAATREVHIGPTVPVASAN